MRRKRIGRSLDQIEQLKASKTQKRFSNFTAKFYLFQAISRAGQSLSNSKNVRIFLRETHRAKTQTLQNRLLPLTQISYPRTFRGRGRGYFRVMIPAPARPAARPEPGTAPERRTRRETGSASRTRARMPAVCAPRGTPCDLACDLRPGLRPAIRGRRSAHFILVALYDVVNADSQRLARIL